MISGRQSGQGEISFSKAAQSLTKAATEAEPGASSRSSPCRHEQGGSSMWAVAKVSEQLGFPTAWESKASKA